MPQPPAGVAEGGDGGGGGGGDGVAVVAERAPRQVDLNIMKRNMTIAKGFLDISLLSANANQLKNVINFGNRESTIFYLILTGIILSLVLQVAAGVILIVAERFDINKEEEQEQGDLLNTVVTCLIFTVLIINVFVASLGVDVADPFQPPHHHHTDDHHHHHDDFGLITTTASGVLKEDLG